MDWHGKAVMESGPESSRPGKKRQGKGFLFLLKELSPPIQSSVVSDQGIKFKSHRNCKGGIVFSDSMGNSTSEELRFPDHAMLCRVIPFPQLLLCFCLLCQLLENIV